MRGRNEQPGDAFEWLVTISSSFGMGATAAFIFSIERVNPELQFAVTYKTWLGFGVVGWLTFLACRALFFAPGDENRSGAVRRRWFLILAILGLGGSAASMAYSLRGVSSAKLTEVGIGVLLAVFVLSILSLLLIRTIHFLNADQERNALSPEDLTR